MKVILIVMKFSYPLVYYLSKGFFSAAVFRQLWSNIVSIDRKTFVGKILHQFYCPESQSTYNFFDDFESTVEDINMIFDNAEDQCLLCDVVTPQLSADFKFYLDLGNV